VAIRSTELLDAIDAIARTPMLLVATDFDGTLAPIVDDPAAARADHNAMVALRWLVELPNTEVAVISGRALEVLGGFLDGDDRLHLVGSHGSEFEAGFARRLSAEQSALLERLQVSVDEIAASHEGVHAEPKPTGVCLHTRRAANRNAAEAATRAVLEGPATLEGVRLRHGKEVVELSVIDADKGMALKQIRGRLGATACLFLGDDVTDEDAFRSLAGPDVGVRIGGGETAATFRLDDQAEVAPLLAALAEARARWLGGEALVPIEHHTMLSDGRTIALLAPPMRVCWFCPPRIDAPALFAELLGGPEAGHWSFTPRDAGDAAPRQRYHGDTLTAVTEWGGARLTDFLDCSGHRPQQSAGRVDLLRVLEGHGTVDVEFAPRLNFGRTPTALEAVPDGLVVRGGLDLIALRSPGVEWTITDREHHQSASATIELAGDPVVFELRFGTQSIRPSAMDHHQRRARTDGYWSTWADGLSVPERFAEPVRRSALILKGLCHEPTGAIVAAGTTSLPEWIGGVRNWDYRYCWPRDATMAAASLIRLGSHAEAMRLLDWLRSIVDRASPPDALAPLYTVVGENVPPEGEISELCGYGGSRPVRVGNAAALQLQLDVFGPIVDMVAMLAEAGAPLSMWHWSLVERFAETVLRRWQEPDHGIWEPRRPPRHHVHTKIMCWTTLRRAAVVGSHLFADRITRFDETCDRIRAEVLERGWSERLGTFTSTYAADDPDAAALWVGLAGMLEPTDERFVATVETVERRLTVDGAVHRYLDDDGLPGEEGAFNLCTAWLVESLAMIGRRERAEALFDRYLALAGPSGLLAEEVDPREGRALGNVPQAYSHLGLIDAALRLAGEDVRT